MYGAEVRSPPQSSVVFMGIIHMSVFIYVQEFRNVRTELEEYTYVHTHTHTVRVYWFNHWQNLVVGTRK